MDRAVAVQLNSTCMAASDFVEVNARSGDLISRARNWRAAFFAAAAIALLAVGGMIVIARQARIVPYVVAVDSLGRTVGSGPAEQATVADDRLKRAALNSWVGDWRLVSMDGIAQRKAIDRAYDMIASGSPAQVAVSEYYSKDASAAGSRRQQFPRIAESRTGRRSSGRLRPAGISKRGYIPG